MDCTQAKQKLQEYIDGTLSIRHMAEIDTHLSNCTSCRKTVKEFQAIVNTVSGLSHCQPGAHFSAKVLGAIELDEQQQTETVDNYEWAISVKKLWPGHRKLGFAFAFSAFAVLLLVDMAHGLGSAI